MTRSTRLTLALLLLGAAPLAAQVPGDSAGAMRAPGRGGWSFGIVAMQGGEWNPTAFEVALVRGVGSARARSVYAGARVGGWTSETAGLTGGTRGWALGIVGGLRQNLVTLMSIGNNERDLDYALLTGTLEFSGNLSHDSPTPDNAHATAAWLFGLAYSDGANMDESFALLLGPAAYIGGSYLDWRLQVGVRFQSPFRRQ